MNVQSIKGKLKNVAKTNFRLYQELLTVYGLERALFRIGKSKYRENSHSREESFCTPSMGRITPVLLRI